MAYPVMSTEVPWSLVKSGFKKTPHFNSLVQKPAAGRRSSIALMPYPTWDFEIDLNYVLGGEGVQGSVLQSFLGCYIASDGGGSPFLFTDPNDNAVTDRNQSLMLNVTPGAAAPMSNVGDAASTQFQLGRRIGQGTDILQQVSAPSIYKYDWQGTKNVLHDSGGLVTDWHWEGASATGTATPNAATSPNEGTFTATKLSIPAVSTGEMMWEQATSIIPLNGDTWVASIYLRADTPCTVYLRTVQSTGQNDVSTVCAVTTRWQRFNLSVTYASVGSGQILFRIGLRAPGDPATAFYASDAQLEWGLAPSAYQRTSSLGSNSWGPTQQFPTARTNLITNSQTLDNVAWTKNNVTVTADATTAPDGTTTADKLIDNATNGEHYTNQALTSSLASTTYTGSVFLKQAELSWAFVGLVLKDGITVAGAYFNLATGAVGTISPGFTAGIARAANGFWYATITGNVGPGASPAQMRVKVTTGNNVATYAGTGQGIYVWGMQAEQSSSATSYIATTAGAVTVTDYTLGATGVVTFALAPKANALLAWTGAFQYLCWFTDDTLKDLARVSKNSSGFLWSCDSIAFESDFV